MSVHTFPLPDGREVNGLAASVQETLHGLTSTAWDGTTLTLTFSPDLTGPETTALTEIVRAGLSTLLTRAERNGIQSDIDGLVTYQGLASPTLAQTVQAVKAQSRILRAILRS